MLPYLMPYNWHEWQNLLLRWVVILAVLIAVLLTALFYIVHMPGTSYHGPFLPLTVEETNISVFLRRHVEKLAGEIGARHIGHLVALRKAAAYIEATFKQFYCLRWQYCFASVGASMYRKFSPTNLLSLRRDCCTGMVGGY
jgi:hypothetical protein